MMYSDSFVKQTKAFCYSPTPALLTLTYHGEVVSKAWRAGKMVERDKENFKVTQTCTHTHTHTHTNILHI